MNSDSSDQRPFLGSGPRSSPTRYLLGGGQARYRGRASVERSLASAADRGRYTLTPQWRVEDPAERVSTKTAATIRFTVCFWKCWFSGGVVSR
jgi:hypothetical protein